MNWDYIEGHCKVLAGKLCEQWGRLTHDESAVTRGRRAQFRGYLQQLQGLDRQEVRRQIRSSPEERRRLVLIAHRDPRPHADC